jgi:hypothetical protein
MLKPIEEVDTAIQALLANLPAREGASEECFVLGAKRWNTFGLPITTP